MKVTVGSCYYPGAIVMRGCRIDVQTRAEYARPATLPRYPPKYVGDDRAGDSLVAIERLVLSR